VRETTVAGGTSILNRTDGEGNVQGSKREKKGRKRSALQRGDCKGRTGSIKKKRKTKGVRRVRNRAGKQKKLKKKAKNKRESKQKLGKKEIVALRVQEQKKKGSEHEALVVRGQKVTGAHGTAPCKKDVGPETSGEERLELWPAKSPQKHVCPQLGKAGEKKKGGQN